MSADGPEIESIMEAEDCKHIAVPLTRRISPLIDLYAILKMFSVLKKYKPEIVHSHTPKAGLVSMFSAYLARVPIRIHTVAGLPLQSASGIKLKLLRYAEKLTYRFATNVWPNSSSLKQYIIENKFTSSKKLDIIGEGSSNGISLAEFDPNNLDDRKLQEIKKQINYDPKLSYLLFVGRVVEDKGIVELIEAYNLLKLKTSNLRLLIVGPFEDKIYPLKPAIIDKINSDNTIICTGFSNDVKYFMSLANVFVFPSHREGFPNVLLQAGAMKCPIICSQITGNVDLIEPGSTGLLFKPRDVNELLLKLEFALDNPMEMLEMAENLQNIVRSKFERRYIQNLILLKYKELLALQE